MSKSRFYSLAYPEHQAMERLFGDSVKAGIIPDSSSPLEDVFFVEKKKEILLACIVTIFLFPFY